MSIFLRTVRLKNYKSIARCRVDLGELTILVGPNGSGKSNFLDALRLVSDGLRSTLEHALRDRGGIGEVRRKSGGHPTHFTISLRLRLEAGRFATYSFEIGSAVDGGPRVKREEAVVAGPESPVSGFFYRVRDGRIVGSEPPLSESVQPDRLYLASVADRDEFRPLFDPLSRMAFYNISPVEMRRSQPHDGARLLRGDGGNIASVVDRLAREDSSTFERIRAFLRTITPGVEGVEQASLGPSQTLVFRQRVQAAKYPWPFYASSMSDGTLRSLCILTALFQGAGDGQLAAPFIAIEEPEAALHPGGARVLVDASFETSRRTQILLTTHSPDLLDYERISEAHVRAVGNDRGNTSIDPVDPSTITALRQDLYAVGVPSRPRPVETEPPQALEETLQGDLFSWRHSVEA
ncbi:MAG: AAA family ATPase [Kiloniellales bacterium]